MVCSPCILGQVGLLSQVGRWQVGTVFTVHSESGGNTVSIVPSEAGGNTVFIVPSEAGVYSVHRSL